MNFPPSRYVLGVRGLSQSLAFPHLLEDRFRERSKYIA
ncbi:hypothetical protein GXM_02707 [Nostoc sphaeroides CCNUC1]|uniref:Uncharacterized protein n=1 Tax=Nostoc sphaeroides CCNUC1 TaxID=2653204 RepID=A0A5P8VXX0_9NOSO|nr:hypothetical protein GXM_02707 [Nostoc sphaeroides CCNUC1]